MTKSIESLLLENEQLKKQIEQLKQENKEIADKILNNVQKEFVIIRRETFKKQNK